jgi:hypothetical protein
MPARVPEIELTPEKLLAVCTALQSRYGTRFIRKDENALMVQIGTALQALGVLDCEAFLKRFTTTLLLDIYAPFEPGVPTPLHGLWSQLVVIVHEHVHVAQYLEDPSFPIRYIVSSADRAHYEAIAYGTKIEIEFWRYGAVMTPTLEIAQHILNYGCGNDAVKVVDAYLTAFVPTVESGALINEPTRIALEVLKAA